MDQLQLSVIKERFSASWASSWNALKEREDAGIQPGPYFMMESDGQKLIIANAFYIFMIVALSLFMNRREKKIPNLKPFMAFYNFTCILAAGYVMVNVVLYKIKYPGSFACNPPDIFTADGKHLAFVMYIGYIQKFWEFIDTWLFILNKSTRQVSFLHVFHHFSITIIVWTFVQFDINGDVWLCVLLNSTVHVLMYSHYLVTCLPKEWGLKVWWRSWLTRMQLGQFMSILVQCIYAWFKGPECGFPDWAKFTMIVYMISMLILFTHFFIKRYLNPEVKDKKNKKA